jgi:hypothetical protein
MEWDGKELLLFEDAQDSMASEVEGAVRRARQSGSFEGGDEAREAGLFIVTH